MMKKYRHMRVALLIGLLGFNTLSSCVSTSQPFISKDLELRLDYYTQPYEEETGIRDKLKVIVPCTFLVLWVTVLPFWVIKMLPKANSSSVFNMTDSNSKDSFVSKGVKPFMFDPVKRSIPSEILGNNSVIPVESLDAFQERLALSIDKFGVGGGLH